MIKFLYKKSELKVGAIRMIGNEDNIGVLEKIIPEMHRDVYYVMKIDI